MNGENMSTPRLTLGHATLAARDLEGLSAFYCDVLGFEITNRGPAGPDSELLFLSQDPGSHHQIAMTSGVGVADSAFVMVDHFAFRTETLDDLRSVHANLIAAAPIREISFPLSSKLCTAETLCPYGGRTPVTLW